MHRPPPQSLRSRSRGGVSLESIALVILVALAGITGLSSFGGATGRAIADGTGAASRTAPTASLVSSAQAAAWGALREATEMASKASEGLARTAKTDGRAVGVVKSTLRRVVSFGDHETVPPEVVEQALRRSHKWPGYEKYPTNPRGDMMNCSACSVSLDHTLNGTPASAMPFVQTALNRGTSQLLRDLLAQPDRIQLSVRKIIRNIRTQSRTLGDDLDAGTRDQMNQMIRMFKQLDKNPEMLAVVPFQIMEVVIQQDIFRFADHEGIASMLGKGARSWKHVADMDDAIALIDAMPNRAKGLVTVMPKDGGMGHVFNFLRYDDRVYFLDGQVGYGHTKVSWSDVDVAVIRTKNVPKTVDVEDFRLPPPVDQVNFDAIARGEFSTDELHAIFAPKDGKEPSSRLFLPWNEFTDSAH